jgi:hypothetical protein
MYFGWILPGTGSSLKMVYENSFWSASAQNLQYKLFEAEHNHLLVFPEKRLILEDTCAWHVSLGHPVSVWTFDDT